jgi:hypothetical protein
VIYSSVRWKLVTSEKKGAVHPSALSWRSVLARTLYVTDITAAMVKFLMKCQCRLVEA